MAQDPDPRKDALLAAILPHVPFDGWSQAAFDAATRDAGMTTDEARAIAPRGAIDLAVAMHRQGDRAMVAALREADLSDRRFRDRVAFAIRARLDAVPDKEAVRRASTLFALPQHAAEGAALIWGTSDLIWTTLGDTATDLNWYTKRATLSAVHASVVLYWLGDTSEGHAATDAFILRRIDNVMQIEKVKAAARANPVLKPAMTALDHLGSLVKAPSRRPPADFPGYWGPRPPASDPGP